MPHHTVHGVQGEEVTVEDFPDRGFDVVTGAFSYSGAAIARELVRSGRNVRTLTGHPGRARPDSGIDVRPLDFDDIGGLTTSLEGATTLYNTYWVRFPHGQIDHDRAIANSRTLFHAARRAGVERIVHISITHPSISSPYAYFRGKAQVERALAEVGLPYAALRPAILFGGDGVLLNNIAWLLRHLPIFGVGGKGDYRIRPVHIDDLASLAVASGAGRTDAVVDAVGPERIAFRELVNVIRDAVGSRSLVLRVPGFAVPPLASLLGLFLRDVLLTGDEYRAMAGGLADTDGPATGTIAVSSWIREHADTLGLRYANEIERHFKRTGR
ncbi:MAG TPA: NAD(P)H-binding protein [Acidimicrobiales bacterium]|jgi:NADH dehydrogenase|nr:NAD(P)H-binding protein [Acidimicrobiales bacterium]